MKTCRTEVKMVWLFSLTCYGFAVGEIKHGKRPRMFSQHFIERKYDIFFLFQSRTKGNKYLVYLAYCFVARRGLKKIEEIPWAPGSHYRLNQPSQRESKSGALQVVFYFESKGLAVICRLGYG
jgi:hypothetical protein